MSSYRLVIFMLFFIFFTACGPLGKARKAYEGGDYSQALVAANKQIAQDSTNSAAWALAGDCYAKLEKQDSAITAYEKVLHLNNTDIATSKKLSAIYISRANKNEEDNRTALRLLNKAEKLDSTSFDVYLKRGKIYQELTYLDKARTDFQKAQTLAPDDPRPGKQISVLDEKEKQADKLYREGLKAYKQKKWITAKKKLNQAAKYNKGNKDILYMSHLANGRRAYKKGSVSALWDGISELGFATQLKPDAPEPWYIMGLCYEKKDRNDFVSAVEPYEKTIKLAPSSEFAKKARENIKKLNTIRERREKFFGK
ncbi:MAG: hypothetical protein DWQ10_14980 [Calditrichaeota bacterium]|nr:MAG: hypothetical protein DWQ10_14980 [Calditrichota bacterium]